MKTSIKGDAVARIEISEEPLRLLFGSVTAYHALMYLAAGRRGYAAEIARVHEQVLLPVQRQLRKFESVGLKLLLEMVDMLPKATYTQRYGAQRRPRRQGEP